MVLIDSSVWIAYFKGDERVKSLNALIDSEELCINELILSELLPSIQHKKENQLKHLLQILPRIDLNIDWQFIIDMQTKNLQHGINKVGIADLIIAQNSIQRNIKLYTLDKHFFLMSQIHDLDSYQTR